MDLIDVTPDDLRAIARQAQETGLRALADYSDFAAPLHLGDTKNLPQESGQDRAAALGLQALREETELLIAKLYALAAVRDRGEEVPLILLEPFRRLIDAYRAESKQTRKRAPKRKAR
jgi:hypothetical protein